MIIQHIEITDYFDELVLRLYNIKSYYITKSQSADLNSIKDNLNNETAIILLDYAENYSFLNQDEIQSVHSNNVQAALHPIVIYEFSNSKLNVNSTCIISNNLLHNISAILSLAHATPEYEMHKRYLLGIAFLWCGTHKKDSFVF